MTPFDEMATADGRLDRPIAQANIELHEVELVGTDLVWTRHRATDADGVYLSEPRYYKPKAGLLENFSNLSGRSDEEILNFARSHGVLGLCKHGVPHTHKMAQRFGVVGRLDPEDGGCQRMQVPRPNFGSLYEASNAPVFFREPIDAWRSFSRKALAILRLANSLHHNQPTLEDDWRALQLEGFADPKPGKPRVVAKEYQRTRLASVINDWIVMGNVRLAFDWLRKPAVVYTSDYGSRNQTLFGALALQVLLVASGSQGLATCSGCHEAFIPKRKPRWDRRAYCDTCRKNGVPMKNLMRDKRAEARLERERLAKQRIARARRRRQRK